MITVKKVVLQKTICTGLLHKLLKKLQTPCLLLAGVLTILKLITACFLSWEDAGLRYNHFIDMFLTGLIMCMFFDMWLAYTAAIPVATTKTNDD